jgi:hypothetical protein
MIPFDLFVLPADERVIREAAHPFVRGLIRRLVNISLASLAAFAIVGSAACALRIVFFH